MQHKLWGRMGPVEPRRVSVQSWQPMRTAVALLAASAAVAAAGLAAGATPVRSATAACPVRSFTVSFDPRRGAIVMSAGRTLASATFTTRSLGASCRRVRAPKGFLEGGLGGAFERPLGFRCAANAPIRVHVDAIYDRGAVVGSNLLVGLGDPMRVIVSAVLKNKGDPHGSRLYRARTYCKLGA
jgi:hypothetical protein